MSHASLRQQIPALQEPSKAASDRPSQMQAELRNEQLVATGARTAVIRTFIVSVLKVSKFFPTGEHLCYTRTLSQFR